MILDINTMYFLAKFFKISLEDTKDGLEIINRTIVVIAILTIVMGLPGAVFAIHNDLPVFRLLNFGHLGLTFLQVVFATACLCLDWTFVISLSLTVLLHTNSTSKWIIRSRRAW